MSILIPKMIMPETCGDCPFFMDEDFTRCGRASYYICDGIVDRNGKPEWCDLIEVPPHGRLIDADAAAKQGWTIKRTYFATPNNMIYEIKKMTDEVLPTVIEADTCNNSEEPCNKDEDALVNASKTGKWIDKWHCSNMSGYEYAMKCSECGKPTYRISLVEPMPNFCPNCGADMRGEDDGAV